MRTPALLLSIAFATVAVAQSPGEYASGKVSFSVSVRGEVTSYRVLAVSVLPGAVVPLDVARGPVSGSYEATATAGQLRDLAKGKWEWSAPDSAGLYPLTIREGGTGESMRLNMFVLTPLSQVRDGRLNGYRIGSYPTTALKGLAIYKPPRGFIEVTEANVDTPVSPHFTLRQFLCKQTSEYPKYVILRERLLLKLELVLERVNAAGFRADTLHVMSGYRTPYYNRAIGNVKYSRHVYGGAADVFIDVRPRDGMMDDLNADGKIDTRDAAVLYDLVDELYGKDIYRPFTGGLGRYKKTAAHGPFVHVDVRGFRARWGS